MNVRSRVGSPRLAGFFKLYVSFAEYRLFYRALLQKRPIISRCLLLIATPCHFTSRNITAIVMDVMPMRVDFSIPFFSPPRSSCSSTTRARGVSPFFFPPSLYFLETPSTIVMDMMCSWRDCEWSRDMDSHMTWTRVWHGPSWTWDCE